MAEKILIVDDDPETINFLNLILSVHGYQVVAARNGVQALHMATSEKPDLIILDIMMPDLDGYTVTRELRSHPETASIPILMFTAKTQLSDRVAGFEAGVDFYLTKPVHPVELQANIKTLITKRRSEAGAVIPKTSHMVGVMAAKGGLGVSTVALNLAIAYRQKFNASVIAAELRPGQGTWAQDLNFTNASGLSTLLNQSPSDISLAAIDNQLQRTSYGVRLLLASAHSEDTALIAAVPQMESLLQQISRLAPLVVLDVGTNFAPYFDQVVDLCHEIVLVVEPQPSTVKRTRVLVDELKARGYGSTRELTTVMINRGRTDMALSVSQVEEALDIRVALGFPPAGEQAFYAAMRAVPLMMVQPDGLIAQQFVKLAELIGSHVG
jgi:DNA-binding response OmpR family regulator